MNELLTSLGIPDDVQDFFNCRELRFDFGDEVELFGHGFHMVPNTSSLWVAGQGTGRFVIVTSSAMEAISFLTCNKRHYPAFESLTFIAIGCLPHEKQAFWIKKRFPKSKFILVFGNDLLGRLADIKIAAGLSKKTIRLILLNSKIQIIYEGRSFEFDNESLSLNVFEKSAGLRTGIRTVKPKETNTFLDQLIFDGNK
jgi:hypothetical protein